MEGKTRKDKIRKDKKEKERYDRGFSSRFNLTCHSQQYKSTQIKVFSVHCERYLSPEVLALEMFFKHIFSIASMSK